MIYYQCKLQQRGKHVFYELIECVIVCQLCAGGEIVGILTSFVYNASLIRGVVSLLNAITVQNW